MSYEIRPLSFGEIVETGSRLVRDHFLLLAGIGIVPYAPLAVTREMVGDVEDLSELPPDTAFVVLFVTLASAVLSPIVQGAITIAIGQLFCGREISIGEAYSAALERAFGLVGTSLLVVAGVIVGLLCLILPGVYLMVAWMLATQVVALEGRVGPDALNRSRELLRDHMLRALGVVLFAAVLVTLLTTAVDVALGDVAGVGAVAYAVAQSIALAFYTGVGVLLYFDLRARSEAFDDEQLATLLGDASHGPG